ncbi:MAG: transglycosylase SLT domain-containing protein, partial [Bacteroidales bacterium]|nr:transglycosylase SLT domain-containing protein [Bacteroidales bacterium]
LEGLRKLSFENWDLMAIPYPAIYPSFPGTTYTEPLFFDDFILYCSDSFQDSSNLEQFDSIRKACCILPYQWDKFILHSFFSDICVCIKNVSWKKLRENFICSDTLRHLLFLGPQKWMSFLIGFKKKNVKSYKQIPFCWVVRIDAAAFIHEINSWIKNQKKTGVINILLTKYYNYVFPLANPLSKSFHSFYSSTLSIYDDIIKKYAGMIGLEWLLAASLIYEESKFQTKLTSRSGAYGIMQLMPFIMERYGIDTSSSVDKQIYVGFLLLSEFNKVFDKFSLPPSVRDRVIITAYNMGFFPLKKCIELIQKKQSLKEVTFKQILDCLENNQEGFRLPRPMLKQGKVFVSNIFERYQIYRELYD